MISPETLRQVIFALPEVTEEPHFEKTSFRVNKKIFATLGADSMLCVKLTPADQDIFTVFDKAAIYSVPNKWGQQGWTNINLDRVRLDMLTDALKAAYCNVAPKLAALVKPD